MILSTMYQSFINARQTRGDFAKLAHLPSEPNLRTNLITHHIPWAPSEKASLWVSGSQPLDRPQRSAVLCGGQGCEAALPGVAQKGLIERRSPGSRAGSQPTTAHPRLGAGAGLAGTPGGGEQAASRNNLRDSPVSRRDLTVSRGRSSCLKVPTPRGARA